MRRRRRLLSMLTASSAVLALGFVVAVAARTLPGTGEEEPFLEIAMPTNVDLTTAVAWTLMILAVLVAVLLVLGLTERRPPVERRRRSILGTVLGLVLFVAIVRWLRPAAEALLDGGASAVDAATDDPSGGGMGNPGAWLFSILLAAVLAAALTRIGVSLKTVVSPFPRAEGYEGTSSPASLGLPPPSPALGDDPRSRIINAYADFESWLTDVGRPRNETETTARHARRSAEELSLDPDEVRALIGHHSRARYGNEPLTELDAVAAERSSLRLRDKGRQ